MFVSEVSSLATEDFVRVSRLLSAVFSSDVSDSASLVLVSLRSEVSGSVATEVFVRVSRLLSAVFSSEVSVWASWVLVSLRSEVSGSDGLGGV